MDYTDLQSDLPLTDIIAALDDDGDGTADRAVWNHILSSATDRLRMAYAGDTPAELQSIADYAMRQFCLESLWRRRYPTADSNPFTQRAVDAEKRLTALASGDGRSDLTTPGIVYTTPTRATPKTRLMV